MVLSTKYGRTRWCPEALEGPAEIDLRGVRGPPLRGAVGGRRKIFAKKVLIPFGINLKIQSEDWKVSHTNKVQKLLLF